MILMVEQKERIPYHIPLKLSDWDKQVIQTRLNEILETGQLTNGIYVRELERKIKEYYNCEHVMATSSCTSALMICLAQTPQDIQVPAFNWYSDFYVLDMLKKKVRWIDIDKDTWLPIEKYPISSLYLHTFGNTGKSFNPNTVYDASHCLFSKFEDIGLATCISLAPTKLITGGEGGLILTNDDKFAKSTIELRDKCCRMPEMNAILALQTLKYKDKILEWKKKVRTYYIRHLGGGFQVKGFDSNWNTIGFINSLAIPGHIDSRQYYQPIFESRDLPNTKWVYERITCLPSYFGVDYKKIVDDIWSVN